jgi:A/G-specific adenine glycosylase
MLSTQQFSLLLLKWNHDFNRRNMPWKGINDPYKIWLSEIILQQTRVDQGEKYYNSITTKYLTVSDLALAKDDEVYKLWQGLGYYNRCRNMLHTARHIHQELNGIFPKRYEDILNLKGIGDYTAAAIASFAYNLPYAVVDGNVVRVLSRVFGLNQSFYDAAGKKFFQSLALELLNKKKSAEYNQAIMDLGATVCKPQLPECNQCPFEKKCIAKIENRINELPVKKEKLKLKVRHFHFFVFEDKTSFYILKRTSKDIWNQLYTFYMIETENEKVKSNDNIILKSINNSPQVFQQVLSHQKIQGYFHINNKITEKEIAHLNVFKINKYELEAYAFPRLLISFFQKNNYL